MTSTTRRLGLPALLLVAAGCGSSGAGTATGTMSVHLRSAPVDIQAAAAPAPLALEKVDLHILSLEAHNDVDGWFEIRKPDATYDILKLTDGVVATLASGFKLPPGKYTQLRLVLGPGQEDADGKPISNLVVLQDGSSHDLTVPSGQQSGVKLVCGPFDVASPGSVDVFIELDAHKSIFVHGTGLAAKFILRPVIRCNPGPVVTPEPGPTGSISGSLTAQVSETVEPLVGVTVTAQVLDSGGTTGSIVASTTTADGSDPLVAAGSFTLDNLPLGATYYVVSQPVTVSDPVTGTAAWDALASPGVSLDASHTAVTLPVSTFQFGPAALVGSVDGTIGPTTDPADQVLLRQLLGSISFVVRTSDVLVGGGTETFIIDLVPEGSYSVSAVRTGGITSSSMGVTVVAGTPASAGLTF